MTAPCKLYEIVHKDGKDGLRLNLHAGQQRAWDSERRIVAVTAGSQSGKTSFMPLFLHREIGRCGPGDYAVVCPTFTLMEVKALPEFKKVFEQIFRLGTYVGSPVRKFTFSEAGCQRMFGHIPDVPTVVYFGYAENPDSLESATYKAVCADEAGQKVFKRESYEAIMRRLAIHRGRLLITTTPYGAGGWLKTEVHDRYKAGDPEVDLINFPSIANPNFPREEFDRARRTLPAWKFQLYYLGLLARPAGMIYDIFNESTGPGGHVCPHFRVPQEWQRYGGLDFGPINTACTLFAEELAPTTRMPTGKLYLYREYHPGKRTEAEHVNSILAGEPGLPLCVGGSASEDEWRARFAAAGLPIREPVVNDVEVGIDIVYAAIKRGEIIVMDNCKETIEEFLSYSRVVDDAGNPTEKIEAKESYHLLDSIRYIIPWLKRGGLGAFEPTSDPRSRHEFAPENFLT